ncbi:MAG: exo-alpha-sialidase [Bacteroidales bacterium]|nr:exo-alpha-sialidase [Bacteroidales bacterium]
MRKFSLTFLFFLICLATKAQNIEVNTLLFQESRLTARSNNDELILRSMTEYEGNTDSIALQSVLINLDATTDINDVKSVKVYTTGLSSSQNNKYLDKAVLIGSCTPQEGDFLCETNGYLYKGINYLWFAVDIDDDAEEGNSIDMSVLSLTVNDEAYDVKNPNPTGSREIILARTTLLRPGDYNSTNYRIPAVITARDGSIVAVTDKRKYNNGDLPEDIDILCNVSKDGGHTWTEPYTIAYGTGYKQGYGDCALALTNDENGIIAAFVGGPGFWGSTPTDPLRMYISRSHDNGMTWSEPEDITHFVYGAECEDEERKEWLGGFFGSGNGLLTSTGRIMFVIAMRENNTREVICNHAVYSDDNGQTWQVSGRASVGGDEAKVTELVDGRILMSIRRNGYRWYNISEDGGVTWQETTSEWTDIVAPACNGDLIRYTSVNDGYDKNRLLHSVPEGSSRKNVTVYVSYDEGESWQTKKCIVPYNSAYSSLCVLPDNTIGLYVEEAYQNEGDYCTVFYNFSLNWLTDGEDDVVSIDEVDDIATMNYLDVYPNPASHYINIQSKDLMMINIYNVRGQLVRSIPNHNEDNIMVDVSDMDNGLYLIEGINLDMSTKTAKFIVEK